MDVGWLEPGIAVDSFEYLKSRSIDPDLLKILLDKFEADCDGSLTDLRVRK
jgi:hypothetical protein